METIVYGLGLVLVPFIWIAVITGIISIARALNAEAAGPREAPRVETFNKKPIRAYNQHRYAA